jgi:hypothetical protein
MIEVYSITIAILPETRITVQGNVEILVAAENVSEQVWIGLTNITQVW